MCNTLTLPSSLYLRAATSTQHAHGGERGIMSSSQDKSLAPAATDWTANISCTHETTRVFRSPAKPAALCRAPDLVYSSNIYIIIKETQFLYDMFRALEWAKSSGRRYLSGLQPSILSHTPVPDTRSTYSKIPSLNLREVLRLPINQS